MKNLLSVRQVAYILKVHPLTIRRYITSGKLKAIKIGGNVRINEEELQSLNKDITLKQNQSIKIKQYKKYFKQFNQDDPILRLQGRGASIQRNEGM